MLAIVQKILYIKRVGIQERAEPTMTLFKTSRLLISTPLDVVEDENYGDVPTEDDEARDSQIDQVESLAAEPSHSDPSALPMHAVKSAWEGIRPDYAQRTDYTHFKKAVIKKK